MKISYPETLYSLWLSQIDEHGIRNPLADQIREELNQGKQPTTLRALELEQHRLKQELKSCTDKKRIQELRGEIMSNRLGPYGLRRLNNLRRDRRFKNRSRL